MISQSLNGKWTLYYADTGEYTVDDYSDFDGVGIPHVEAQVPGNVELDLSKAGVLPEDLFMGNVINEEVRKIETWEWWYKTEFTPDEGIIGNNMVLNFEAVDCFAEYYLNGKLLGTSENALIAHKFDVAGLIEDKNVLIVHIRSPFIEPFKNYLPHNIYRNPDSRHIADIGVRKAPHCYGWDIMPRALSAGIWRGVTLENHDSTEISDVYAFTYQLKDNNQYATVMINYNTNLDYKMFAYPAKPLYAKAEMKCGDSVATGQAKLHFKDSAIHVYINKPKLWWPYGYGEANLYDTRLWIEDSDGNVLAETTFKFGIRTIKLLNDEYANNLDGRFAFIVNGVEIYCTGSNWVPMSPYHSMDNDRYDKALELFHECGCNILRCWGGNVYEDHKFYDLCDKYGIMVWQDFTMACNWYPQEDWFYDVMREEAEYIVKKLRNHCSIIMWAGDNECDEPSYITHQDPAFNKITREVLPKVCEKFDMYRPYLPSSPYFSDKIFQTMLKNPAATANKCSPEIHAWGPRDYFKGPFYTQTTASFISETGYHGCPNVESIKKFIHPDKLYPYLDNDEWNLHSTDVEYRGHRVKLMHDHLIQLFGEVPDNLEDFAIASQISQAEAKKFFIERIRAERPHSSGIIWWNMLDGWPQMSDAIVDFYYSKKLAFDYIKRCQAPFSIFLTEINGWGSKVIASNCSLNKVSGSYKIYDADTGETLIERGFGVEENANREVGFVRLMFSEQRMLIIEWTLSDGTKGKNHYLAGFPPFNMNKYMKEWLPKIMEEVK